MTKPFHPRPKISAVGDENMDDIYHAVGRALVTWEWTEGQFAHLFGVIITPPRGSVAAQRAYGSIISAKARKEALKEAADYYFSQFPSDNLEKMFSTATKLYDQASSRRNDIAHAVVTAGPSNHNGYYLAANLYTSKRNIRTGSPYYYTTKQINAFNDGFIQLAHLASGTRQFIALQKRK